MKMKTERKDTDITNSYLIGQQLGHGRFGTVNICWHKRTRAKSAVRLIKLGSNNCTAEADKPSDVENILGDFVKVN